MKNSFLILILSIFVGNAYAQPWMKNVPERSNNNFFEIQKAFNDYWEGKSYVKGKGYKQFRRWENFVEERIDNEGNFNNNEFARVFLEKLNNNNKGSSGNWQKLGPTDTPLDIATNERSGNGRVNCIAFHPANSNIIYIGAPAGGIWKTTDGGASWSTTSDYLASIGVSSIAVHPQNPDTIFIATGDGDGGDTYTIGVLKSHDGGATWLPTGLTYNTSNESRIQRILINPNNPDIILASASDGIYRSTDGGNIWTNVKSGYYKDLKFKSGNPNVVFATSYGYSDAKVYRSMDGGQIFWEITTGIPSSQVNRIEIGVTAADTNIVYALCGQSSDNGLYGVFKSINGGDNWSQVYDNSNLNLLGWNTNGGDAGGQAWYDLGFAVSPTDPDQLYVGGVNIWRSMTGGASWAIVGHWYGGGADYVHADHHMLAFQPGTNVLFSGNDGGIYKTLNNGITWYDISDGLEILQIYKIGVAATESGIVVTGNQDNGSMKYDAPEWKYINGGDGMDCMIDHSNSDIIYTTIYYGTIYRSTNGGYYFNEITPYAAGNGAWVTPFAMDPNSATTIYGGYSDVYKTTDAGGSWWAISSNLTGGSTLRSLKIAPSNTDYIYTATYDNIYSTSNGGGNWTNVTSGLPSSPNLKDITISDINPNHIWVCFSGFEAGQKVYVSTDGGQNWNNYSDGIPNIPVNCLTYQNNSNDIIYAGTDLGVYYRTSSMNQWMEFSSGLPNVIVNELEIYYPDQKIIAGTYGRGLWESDIYYEPMAPTAGFSFTTNSGCNTTVEFYDESINFPDQWIWNFGDGTTSTDANPVHVYNAAGTYIVELITINSLGSDTLSQTFQLSLGVNEPTANNESRCGAGDLLLNASGSGKMKWYDAIAGGNLLDTGTTLFIPYIDSTRTYFVENETGEISSYGGKTDNSGGGGYYSNTNSWGLVFDCNAPSIIQSVKVYADPSGVAATRLITLLDANNNLIASENVMIQPGESRISLNFEVQPGTGYKLVGPPQPDLYRNNNGANYPFNIGTLVTIQKSTIDITGYDPLQYYYYFYDWEVSTASCPSNRIAVQAEVYETPTADFTYTNSGLNYNFVNQTNFATDYLWDFGDGNTSTAENPQHTFSSSGTYTVMLISNNGACSDSASKIISVVVGIENINSVSLTVVPNPSSGNFNIEFYNTENTASLNIFDISGKKVYSEEINENGKINKKYNLGLAQGTYQISVQFGETEITKQLQIKH